MLILQDYELNISLDTEINAGELDKKLIDSTIEAASEIINSDLIAAKEKQIEDTQKEIGKLNKKIEDIQKEIDKLNNYIIASNNKNFSRPLRIDSYPYKHSFKYSDDKFDFSDSGNLENESLYREYIISLVTKQAFERERDRILDKLKLDLNELLNETEKIEVAGLQNESDVEKYYNKIDKEIQNLQKSMSNIQEQFKTLDDVADNYKALQDKLDEIKRKQNILETISDGLIYLKKILIEKDNACYGPIYIRIKQNGKWVKVKQLRYSESKSVSDYISEINQRAQNEINNNSEAGKIRIGVIPEFKFEKEPDASSDEEKEKILNRVYSVRNSWKSRIRSMFSNAYYTIDNNIENTISKIFYYKKISESLIELFKERIEQLNNSIEENRKTIDELNKTLKELTEEQPDETVPDYSKQVEELKNAIIAPDNTVAFYTTESVNTDIEVPDVEQAVNDILNDAGTDFVKALKSQASFNIGLRKQLYLVMSSIQYLSEFTPNYADYAIYIYASGIAAVCMNYFNIGTLSVSLYTPPPIFEIGIKILGNSYPGLVKCITDIVKSNDCFAFDPTMQQCDGVSKALGDLFKTNNGNMEVVFGLKGGWFVRPFFGTAKGKSNCVDKIIYISMLAAYKMMELGAKIPESWKQVLEIPKNRKDGNDFLAAFMAAGIKLSLLLGGVTMNDTSRGSTGHGIFIPFAP